MKINWFVVGLVIVIVVFLVFFVIKRNLKDEKNYTKYLKKNDKTTSIEGEIDSDEL
jgi:preprotein translocase subunit YajC